MPQLSADRRDGSEEMKPYYEHAGIVIYHGDCREIVPSIGRFDLLLTDPPYGLGIANNPVRQAHAKRDWDDAPVDSVLLLELISIAERSIVWGGNYFNLPPNQCFFVWDKIQPEDFSLAMCEQAWSNIKLPAKLFRKSVLSYFKEHPTQKPVELMSFCINHAGNISSVIDPFMGSGTTLRACKDAGIKCVGIEREEAYCEIASRRLEQEVFAF